ncbi:MAG: hypothetical protein QOI16_1639 [Pseudonocardiales bacterium]|nr:hypothetical protein [Pseudonocardiales bacterium]
MSAEGSAAKRYKDVIAELTAGFDGDAARSAGRVAQLKERVAELGRDLKAASDHRVVTRVGNVLAWEDALEILWVESWMTMRPFPKPDRLAKGDPAVLVSRVEARVADLRMQVQRRGLFGR